MRESRVSPARRTEGVAIVVAIVVAIATLLASPAFADDPLLEHWAFRPLDDAPPSIAREADQAARDRDEHVCDPLDAHVAAALARRDLAPAPPADRATLVRRVHLTLTGLPPTPDVMASALADANPDWYERLVDELLASPRYGERWARHWLDVVRYAESHGFETNRPRRNAWHYRDWVIDAFNRDTPYDRFIAEQLAGDELGADAATGFLVAGPNDIVKSPDIGLTLMQRADELADVVDAASTTFLALTVACARCHDHKFDPISQRDYYALSAIFAGVQHGERPLRRALGADERDRLAALDERLARVLGELGETPVREAVDHERNVERFEPVVVRAIRFTVLATDGAEPCIDEFEVWSAGEDARNVALASSGATASASGTLPGYDIHRLEHLNDGRYGNARSWISNTRGSGWVEIEFARPVMIDRVVWGRDREGQYRDRLATSYRVEVGVEVGVEVAGENAVDDDSGDREWRTVAVSDDRRPRGAPAERFPVVREMLTTAESARASVLLDELLEVERSRDAIAGSDGPKVWAGTFSQPPMTRVLYRGDPQSPREEVAPGTIAALGGTSLPADAPESSRRLALARWIGERQSSLAARVLVNRLWQHHMGEGLVTTPNDFGVNGGTPSHPGLLDFLARELLRGDWSVKRVQRRIVLSAAFRRSSASRPDAAAVDAGNTLLWRFAPRRVEAEVIRDAMLLVSGSLDLSMGGPGFDLVVAREGNVYNYDTKRSFGPADWRRMVYGHHIRGERDATFGAFDCPDGGQIAARRSRSTTALQALNLLNSPFVLQQARRFAGRVEREAGRDPTAQVRRAFVLALTRQPTAAELADAVALVETHGLTALCRALYNSNEFLFVP